MHYHAQARKNMVDSQLIVSGVLDQKLLDAFSTMRREEFLPENLQHLAYADATLDLGDGHFLLKPAIQGRMIQAAQISKEDSVIVLGCSVGYGAALVSRLAKLVVCDVESDEAKRSVVERLYRLKCDNVLVENKSAYQEPDGSEFFEVILVMGCLPFPPERLLKKLSENGRLLYIENSASPKVVQLTQADRSVAKQYLFDVFSPCDVKQDSGEFVF